MTNQFTDEQVEAAAKVLWERHALNGEWDAGSDTGRDECRDDARAALEAAAGVAPQAPNAGESTAGLRSRGDIECKPAVQPSGKVQDSPEIENFGSEISITVQPSSAVDGITDVLGFIDKTIDNGEGGTWTWGNHEVMEMLAEIRGKVEAIGGEGRGHN